MFWCIIWLEVEMMTNESEMNERIVENQIKKFFFVFLSPVSFRLNSVCNVIDEIESNKQTGTRVL